METSILAKERYDKSGNKQIHYNLIKTALKTLKTACAKQIAEFTSLSQAQVSRRMSELTKFKQVKVASKELTKYHRTAVNIYQLSK